MKTPFPQVPDRCIRFGGFAVGAVGVRAVRRGFGPGHRRPKLLPRRRRARRAPPPATPPRPPQPPAPAPAKKSWSDVDADKDGALTKAEARCGAGAGQGVRPGRRQCRRFADHRRIQGLRRPGAGRRQEQGRRQVTRDRTLGDQGGLRAAFFLWPRFARHTARMDTLHTTASAWSASTPTTPSGAARTISTRRSSSSNASSARYVDLHDAHAQQHLYDVEKRNIAVFGYGVKGMVLSMIESAVAITGERIRARDVHRIVELGKGLLQHPVELLPGIREAVEEIAGEHDMVLITKGDLFHQEAKVEAVRVRAVVPPHRDRQREGHRDLCAAAGGVRPACRRFVMVGNSLRSDIAPVLALGGWGVHVPYHTTWAHENEAAIAADAPRCAGSSMPARCRRRCARSPRSRTLIGHRGSQRLRRHRGKCDSEPAFLEAAGRPRAQRRRSVRRTEPVAVARQVPWDARWLRRRIAAARHRRRSDTQRQLSVSPCGGRVAKPFTRQSHRRAVPRMVRATRRKPWSLCPAGSLLPSWLPASASAALSPAPAHAGDGDDLVRVLVDVADVVLRGGIPYYRHGDYGYDDRLIVGRDRYGRPVYYRNVPRGYDKRSPYGNQLPQRRQSRSEVQQAWQVQGPPTTTRATIAMAVVTTTATTTAITATTGDRPLRP